MDAMRTSAVKKEPNEPLLLLYSNRTEIKSYYKEENSISQMINYILRPWILTSHISVYNRISCPVFGLVLSVCVWSNFDHFHKIT